MAANTVDARPLAPAENAVTWGRFQVALNGRPHSCYEQALDAEQLAAKFRSMGWRASVSDKAAKPRSRVKPAPQSERVVRGFRVVADGATLSGMFTVKDAAEQFAELARSSGHPTATLETVYCYDDAAGLL